MSDNIDMDMEIDMDIEITQIDVIKPIEASVIETSIIEVIKPIEASSVIKKKKNGIESVVKNLKRSWSILNKLEFDNLDSFEKMLITKMCNESITKLKKIKKEL